MQQPLEASISSEPIIKSTQDFHINKWQRCLFVNDGDLPVTILGVRLEKKDSIVLGGQGYILNQKITITFDPNLRKLSQKVICIYEVTPNC